MSAEATVLTVEQVAQRWAVNRKTVYLLIQKGQISVLRFGTAIRIPKSAVESFEKAASRVEGNDASPT